MSKFQIGKLMRISFGFILRLIANLPGFAQIDYVHFSVKCLDSHDAAFWFFPTVKEPEWGLRTFGVAVTVLGASNT